MTTAELIEAASKRLLTINEQSQLVRGLWKGSEQELRQAVNRAYAMAKKYDRLGGVDLLNDLQHEFDRLGSSDFRVLYGAIKK